MFLVHLYMKWDLVRPNGQFISLGEEDFGRSYAGNF